MPKTSKAAIRQAKALSSPTAREASQRGASRRSDAGKIRQRDAAVTRAKILEAAMEAFAEKGLDASIEDVADAAGANRRMAYYYFGSKEGLYVAALETVFLELARLEASINVDELDPFDAIEALVSAKFDHFVKHPRYVEFLKLENLHQARYFKTSKALQDLREPLINVIKKVLHKGQSTGVIRSGVDPVELYIAICAVGYFAFSNQYTLAASLGLNVTAPAMVERRRRMMVDMIGSYLRAGDLAPASARDPSHGTKKLQHRTKTAG